MAVGVKVGVGVLVGVKVGVGDGVELGVKVAVAVGVAVANGLKLLTLWQARIINARIIMKTPSLRTPLFRFMISSRMKIPLGSYMSGIWLSTIPAARI